MHTSSLSAGEVPARFRFMEAAMQDRSTDSLPKPPLGYLVFQGVLVWVAVSNLEPLLYLPVWYPLSVAVLWLLTNPMFVLRSKVGRAWSERVSPALYVSLLVAALALLPLPYVSTLVGSEERPGYLAAFAAGFFLYWLPLTALALAGLLMELRDWHHRRDAREA
ncbi:MAG TPA: hypothetical protein VFQ76_01480 [Longimicrobiaceae bacterium]|nr:hypothetical protein [Longimicrobiaceae bacterium]